MSLEGVSGRKDLAAAAVPSNFRVLHKSSGLKLAFFFRMAKKRSIAYMLDVNERTEKLLLRRGIYIWLYIVFT